MTNLPLTSVTHRPGRRGAVSLNATRAMVFFASALALSACAAGEPAMTAAASGAHAAVPVPAVTKPAGTSTAKDAPFPQDVLYKLLVAEFAGHRGKVEMSLKYYLEAARESGDPAVAERAVRIAVYARNEKLGLQAAKLWRKLAPHSTEAQQVYAVLLLRAGKVDDAIREFKALVARFKEPRGAGYDAVADMLSREGDKHTAIRVMQRVIAGHEKDPDAMFAYARLLAHAGELDRASEELKKVIALAPDDDRALVFHARILQQQGATTEALGELQHYVSAHPDDNAVRMTYARLLVDAKRYAQARDQFEKISKAEPDNADVRYALGLLLLQTDRIGEAEKQFKALVGNPERRDAAHFYLGQIAETRKDYEGALKQYRQVYDGQHYFNSQLRIAVLLAEEKKIDEARNFLHNLTPENSQEAIRIYRAEAEILSRAGRLADAMAVYDRAVQEYPTSSDLLYARAMLAERMNRLDILEHDLRTIIAREPDNADALNALGYTLADRSERLGEALKLIKRAMALKPNDHYIIDSMGWVLYRLGRKKEAITYLRKALDSGEDPEIAAHLGEVLWVTGDHKGARETWNAALRSTPDNKHLLEVMKRFHAK